MPRHGGHGTAEVRATGIVLAGGRSSRFGRDKLAEPYRGSPLLHHPVLRLAETCGEVVVVLGPEGPEPSMPLGAPVRFARDATSGQGPLVGVVAGLAAVRTDHALVVGGDMPELATPVLLEMLKVAGEARADAVTLGDGDRPRPLPCVLRCVPASEAAHALLHTGSLRLRDLLDALPNAVLDEATWTALDPARATLRDVDEPSDLEDR